MSSLKKKLLKNIQKLKSSEGWLKAGWPRYNTLFGRDSLISGWQLLNHDPTIAKATLKALARYQGEKINPKSEEEPGKILHEYEFSWIKSETLPKECKTLVKGFEENVDYPYYGSIDSTPLFIILASQYFKKTKDEDFVRNCWKNLELAFKWLIKYADLDEDGLIEYQRKNPYGNFHKGWKDLPFGWEDFKETKQIAKKFKSTYPSLWMEPPVAIVEAQGYLYAAFNAFANLAKKIKRKVSLPIEEKARKLKEKFNRDFWMPDNHYFCFALDGNKRQQKAITSNPGHLLFTGIVKKRNVKPLVKRLFEHDLWTPYGIRNHSSKEQDFNPRSSRTGSIWPHDNWMIWKGLKKLNFKNNAGKIRKAMLEAFNQMGRIPEIYAYEKGKVIDLSKKPTSIGFKANPIQAWSSGALLDMLEN